MSTTTVSREGLRPVSVAARLVGSWVVILAVMVGLGLLLTRPLAHAWPVDVEDVVNRRLAASRTPFGNDVTFWFSELGSTAVIVALCAVVFVVLRLTLHRWREGLFVAACTIGQSLVFLATTLVIDRERPDVEHLDTSPPTSSFPSGHTSAAMALYLSLAYVVHRNVRPVLLRRLLILLLALLPLCVAFGRLYRGMHHPTDVGGSAVNASLIIGSARRIFFGPRGGEDER